MTTIIGIAGSLRRGSYNAALLRAAVDLAPTGIIVETASIRSIPLYDGDVEAERGIPDAVRELKDRIANADALLLVTPRVQQFDSRRVQECDRLVIAAAG
jgi:chromate reductase, NAD(P)H dehydrogenase (quinone)